MRSLDDLCHESSNTRKIDLMQGPVAIILAAGQGKRMKSKRAKVLHEVCGRPMIHYVVDAARGAGAKTIIVVIGYAADQVRQYFRARPISSLPHKPSNLVRVTLSKFAGPCSPTTKAHRSYWLAMSLCSARNLWLTCLIASRWTKRPVCSALR